MEASRIPTWEQTFVDEVIAAAEQRLADEDGRRRRRAVQLAREQAYHRLAIAIDRPRPHSPGPGQLSLFPTHLSLFDDCA